MKNIHAVLVSALLALNVSAFADNYYHNATDLQIQGLQSPWGVAHSSSNLYVSDWQADVIRVYDQSGALVRSIGHTGSAPGELNGPKGMAVDASTGRLFVADAGNERIQVLNADGSSFAVWGDPTAGQTSAFSPEDIALAADGRVYVSDAENHRIVVFDRNGAYLSSFGHLGFSGTASFAWPEGVTLDGQGNLYVADSGNGRIMEYTADGVFIKQIGQRGLGAGKFDSPFDVVVNAQGHIFVADNGGQRVQAFQADGSFEFWWGQNQNGAYFEDLYGMDLGLDGRVLVADGMSGRIIALTWEGLADGPTWVGNANNARNGVKDAVYPPSTFAVGPVPAAPGEPLCMTLTNSSGNPSHGEWKIYTIDSRLVAEVSFNGEAPQCWSGSAGLPKGIYFFQMNESWADGRHMDRVQKVVLR